jgi:3-(3-hydroxy-phenyl)propionate hydroxylase
VTGPDPDVLIAGGGPVGMVAAFALHRAGVRTLLLEAAPTTHEDLRASTFHPPTLEMLEGLGLLSGLLPQGLKAPVIQYRIRRTGTVLPFDLGELADITPFPFRLQCEQWKLVRAVSARLGPVVRFGHRVDAVAQDDTGVTVTAATPDGLETLRARYLIAADGAGSRIRKSLGVGFEGYTWPEKFLTLSTAEPLQAHFDDLAQVNYVSDPEWWHVLLRVPGLWRVLVAAPYDMPDEALLADANIARLFDRLIGDPSVETRHRTIYRVHQRVAGRFDHGRVLLVGDAAHLNNPLGGLGMNGGIHDALNLADKLVAILQGADAAELLPRFGRQRKQVQLDFIQAQTVQNKAMMDGSEEARLPLFQALADTLKDPVRRRAHLLRQAMFTSLAEAASVS